MHHDVLHNPECQLTRSSSGDWISLSLPVGQLEQMLGTKYHVYKHSTTETTVIRTISYSLPAILHDHITVVTPSTYFGHLKPQDKTSFIQLSGDRANDSAVSPTCETQITPSCLDALYNISYTPVSTKSNSLGVTGYLNQYVNHADLQVGADVRGLLSGPLTLLPRHSSPSIGRKRSVEIFKSFK